MSDDRAHALALADPAYARQALGDRAPADATVIQRIHWVMERMERVGKTDSADGVKFNFRGIETILKASRDLIVAAGLVILPWAEFVEVRDLVGKGQGGWTSVRMTNTWRIYGLTGDMVEARTLGIGDDNQDRGGTKAQTQSMKYLLNPMLLIADPADDGDRHNTDVGWNDNSETDPAVAEQLWFEAHGWPGKTEHDEMYGPLRDRHKAMPEDVRKTITGNLRSLWTGIDGPGTPPFPRPVMNQYKSMIDLAEMQANMAPQPPAEPDPFDQLGTPAESAPLDETADEYLARVGPSVAAGEGDE